MLDFSRYEHRCGYIIHLDAGKRYFEAGHHIPFDHIKPPARLSRGKGKEKGKGKGKGKGKKKLSAERLELRKAEYLMDALTEFLLDCFRCFRRDAPPEARVRFVLPHSWRREVPHENPRFGNRPHKGLFLPTDSGIGAHFRRNGPTDVDRERLEVFIETMNGLLPHQDADADADNGEQAKSRFTVSDFTFETIPEDALLGPLLDEKEMGELLRTGPESMELYGVSPRAFIETYFPGSDSDSDSEM
ncbi:hypothetical protein GSI_03484 [Ganoderma sinense ZZ0214-1]|uniref:Uncharacterized protein n=1 Tax=Ganoderma sinense ZZ0214-1 TaxID=1077348 RepID=A0A2G8SLR4_9APHY|nr:hypothetical protein GSI_03484 [Ganoderma sinense ZZ0214-1]